LCVVKRNDLALRRHAAPRVKTRFSESGTPTGAARPRTKARAAKVRYVGVETRESLRNKKTEHGHKEPRGPPRGVAQGSCLPQRGRPPTANCVRVASLPSTRAIGVRRHVRPASGRAATCRGSLSRVDSFTIRSQSFTSCWTRLYSARGALWSLLSGSFTMQSPRRGAMSLSVLRGDALETSTKERASERANAAPKRHRLFPRR